MGCVVSDFRKPSRCLPARILEEGGLSPAHFTLLDRNAGIVTVAARMSQIFINSSCPRQYRRPFPGRAEWPASSATLLSKWTARSADVKIAGAGKYWPQKEVTALPLPSVAPHIVPAHNGEIARQRGTVALVVQKHFGASSSS